MSWPALGWASEQKPGRVADKMVLIALADRHSMESGVAYPSVAWLAEFACVDRKTVIASLSRLEAAGLIEDTGLRVGKTKQIKAYRLALNSPEKGIPETEPFKANSPTFSTKESQKRDTEPVLEPVLSNDKTKRALGKRDCPEGVPPDLWADFLEQRKSKFTPNALKGLLAEADKARWTLDAALSECVSRGWQSFKADWVQGNGRNSRPERKSVLDIAAELGGDCGPPVGLPSLGPPGWHDRG